MAAIAQEMGATHKLDLTSDVTHLIVGNTDTPKYKYVAKERQDIKVLSPRWREAVRASWMEGGDTDVAALEEQHKLPAFAGLQICVTGFDDCKQHQPSRNLTLLTRANSTAAQRYIRTGGLQWRTISRRLDKSGNSPHSRWTSGQEI